MLDRKLYNVIEQALGEDFITAYPISFSKRIIVQKALYLLTHGKSNLKVTLPYQWSFYLHGPYSSEIAHMIYHINDFLHELDKSYKLDENEKSVIQNFKKFKEDIDQKRQRIRDFQRISEEQLYEIIATLIYASKQLGAIRNELIRQFYNFKPELKGSVPESMLNSICSILSQYNYL
ncbi:MAG: hypothetical protein ACFFCV_11810 [Promethearchaeota archaeon]